MLFKPVISDLFAIFHISKLYFTISAPKKSKLKFFVTLKEKGFTKQALEELKNLKNQRKRCKDLLLKYPDTKYFENKKPWEVAKAADLAFPCATQNELNQKDAERLADMKCLGVFEGANMPSDNNAIKVLMERKVGYIPGKAANAGGVAVSCFEMAQNSARMVWKREKVDKMLQEIMGNIFRDCASCAEELGQKVFEFGKNKQILDVSI